MGKVKSDDFVNKQLNELFELGNKVIEEVKEKEKELKKKKIVVGKSHNTRTHTSTNLPHERRFRRLA